MGEETYDRLARIQGVVQAKKDEGALVQQWDDTTYNAALAEAKTNQYSYRNYAQRQADFVAAATDPTNPNQWRPGHRATDAPGSLPQPVQQPTQVAPPQPIPVAPPQPHGTQVPPPVPSKLGRPQLGQARGGQAPEEEVTRSLSSRVLNTPWAKDFKRPRSKVEA